MIPAAFQYERAFSVEEALTALASDPDAKLLSGGHSLLPMMKLRLARPTKLIDITRIPELCTITIESDRISIGAAVRYHQVAGDRRLADVMPLLGEAVRVIADPQVRHRGTIGGSAAHADPSSDLAAVFLASEAEFRVLGPRGERRIPADGWYVAPLVTTLEPDEMLMGIDFPRPLSSRQTYLKFPHPASGYALAGVAALLSLDAEGRVRKASVAVTGAASMPFRAEAAADRLLGQTLTKDVVREASELGSGEGEYTGDVQYSALYRQNLARVMIQRALERLVQA